MFDISHVALEDPPNEVQLQCELADRKRHLCVRAVCCTSHEGMVGIDVHLGTVQDVGGAVKKFTIDEIEYGVIATKATNEHGWAGFANASDHEAKTCAVWIEARDYYVMKEVENDEDEDGNKKKVKAIVATAFQFRAGHHTVITAVAQSQIPLIPADFDAKVSAMAEQMTRVRLLADHGPNLGNQSAALALIQNLRRVGFAGPIDVLVDSFELVEAWTLKMTFEYKLETGNQQFGVNLAAVPTRIQEKLSARYPDAVWERDRGVTYNFAGDEPIELPPGENLRLAQAFKDLPFPYRLTVAEWNTPPPAWPSFAVEEDDGGGDVQENDDDVQDEQEEPKKREVPPEELAGTTEATAEHDYLATVVVNFNVPARGEESLDAKLKKLDPAYDQDDAYENVTWIKKEGDGSLPEFDDDVSETKTVVGMVAGGEANAAGVETYRKDKLKTHSIVALQPLLWHPENRFCKLKDKPVMGLCLPDAASYFVSEQGGDPLATLQGQVGAVPGAALHSIVQAAGTGNYDLMVAYGVHQARSSSAAVVLDNLARALSKGIADAKLKKTILLVICKAGIDLPLDHAKVVRAAVDQHLAGKIADLGADQILFVHTLPMAQRSFQILAQKGTLPFLLEGANTANQMQMLGKPYLSVCSDTTGYVEVPTHADGHTKLQALTDQLNDSAEDTRVQRVAALAKYIGDAKDAAAVLDGYFPKLNAHVKRKPLDQVKWGLYRLKRALDAAPVPSSEQCRPTV